MSLDREKLGELKEGFWKINESRLAFQNDKVTVYGPVQTQEEMNKLGAGSKSSIVQRNENEPSYFNQYFQNAGVNFYVVIPNGYPNQKYIVSVDPEPQGGEAKWFDMDDRQLDPEQALQLHVEFGIPHGLLGECKKKK